MKKLHLLAMAVFLVLSQSAFSAVTPLALSIVPPAQLPPSDFTVTGARVSVLWGKHRHVYGFDVAAIGNVTDNNFAGIAVSGGFNLTKGSTSIVGLQAAGITNTNLNKTNVVGLQLAGVWNSNTAESSIWGAQIAMVNWSPFTKVRGIQVGLYNRAHTVYGLQVGLVNEADSLHGIQIGLLNFNKQGLFAIAPILNVGF